MESNGVVCNDLWNIQEVPPEHMGSIPVLTAKFKNMKYLLSLFLLVGCIDDPPPTIKTDSKEPDYDMIVKIRGCEYVMSRGYSAGADFYVHCGDCTNPEHKNK